ncbi:hypothetical protein LEA_18058, partial [human gut metagenome]
TEFSILRSNSETVAVDTQNDLEKVNRLIAAKLRTGKELIITGGYEKNTDT